MRAAAKAAGRDPQAITGAMYLTLAIDDDAQRADAQDQRLSRQLLRRAGGRHARPPAQLRRPASGAAAWLKSYADAGATHLMLRFAGDHERHLELAARIKRELGWS